MLGVIAVQSRKNREKAPAETPGVELMKNRALLAGLASSDDTQTLMTMLRSQGGVEEAAKAAAGGDPGQLMAMVNRLMSSKEGSELVARIEQQARRAGLE